MGQWGGALGQLSVASTVALLMSWVRQMGAKWNLGIVGIANHSQGRYKRLEQITDIIL